MLNSGSGLKKKKMDRRKFLRNSGFLGLGSVLVTPSLAMGSSSVWTPPANGPQRTAKNIIFLVSDGMSIGTLTMADAMMRRKLGKRSRWIEAYETGSVKRALMDTASADALVTDSAAAGSSWGGGVRVPNGKLNMSAEGEKFEPILQKFKKAGKSVGCVTTVQITHATPASFCVNMKHRSMQDEIAAAYLDLKFDVMMGGGLEHFDGTKRKDKRDLFGDFSKNGFGVAKTKAEMNALANTNKPVLGVYHENGLPYTIDHRSDKTLQETIPTLAEMTSFAIEKMKSNSEGFVLQVEGGKVDWAAHGNDTGGIIYDQEAFDDAVGVALDFAAKNEDTLIVITTDHGNSNPGLFYGKDSDKNFEKIFTAKHSNEWILKEVNRESSVKQVIERVEFASNCVLTDAEALDLLGYLATVDPNAEYNPYKLPFEKLAQLQKSHTNIGWAANTHTADFVELGMYGAGAEMLTPFVKNSDLHNFMLVAAGV